MSHLLIRANSEESLVERCSLIIEGVLVLNGWDKVPQPQLSKFT